MPAQIPLDEASVAKALRQEGAASEITPGLAYRRIAIVNVAFLGMPHRADWVLIDAGLPGSAGLIERTARDRFGGNPPAAIVLTHGHFDHVGALEQLADRWRVPIFAHALEWPYLDGSASYPAPDPRVGGGLMSWIAPAYPRGPVDVSRWLQVLPDDGSIPPMPGWQWLHTPGHTPGHVSLWRKGDRTLIAGDAFITTGQESAYAVARQRPELHGPPAYYTQNWDQARQSVARLAALEPELVLTGHGRPMHGLVMRQALHRLADEFGRVAIPAHGHYVTHPTTVDDGSAYARRR